MMLPVVELVGKFIRSQCYVSGFSEMCIFSTPNIRTDKETGKLEGSVTIYQGNGDHPFERPLLQGGLYRPEIIPAIAQ